MLTFLVLEAPRILSDMRSRIVYHVVGLGAPGVLHQPRTVLGRLVAFQEVGCGVIIIPPDDADHVAGAHVLVGVVRPVRCAHVPLGHGHSRRRLVGLVTSGHAPALHQLGLDGVDALLVDALPLAVRVLVEQARKLVAVHQREARGHVAAEHLLPVEGHGLGNGPVVPLGVRVVARSVFQIQVDTRLLKHLDGHFCVVGFGQAPHAAQRIEDLGGSLLVKLVHHLFRGHARQPHAGFDGDILLQVGMLLKVLAFREPGIALVGEVLIVDGAHARGEQGRSVQAVAAVVVDRLRVVALRTGHQHALAGLRRVDCLRYRVQAEPDKVLLGHVEVLRIDCLAFLLHR